MAAYLDDCAFVHHKIRSAFITDWMRWAMMKCAVSPSARSGGAISDSVSVSTLEVESSRIRIAGSSAVCGPRPRVVLSAGERHAFLAHRVLYHPGKSDHVVDAAARRLSRSRLRHIASQPYVMSHGSSD